MSRYVGRAEHDAACCTSKVLETSMYSSLRTIGQDDGRRSDKMNEISTLRMFRRMAFRMDEPQDQQELRTMSEPIVIALIGAGATIVVAVLDLWSKKRRPPMN